MEIWKQLLLMIFTPTAAVAVLAYVLRKFFDRSLDRDLELYRSQLQLQQFEYQTRYSLIHQRRAEVIGEFYKLLIRGVGEVEDLVRVFRFSDGEPLSAKKQRAADRFNEMSDYFSEHRLYFDESLSERIDELIRLVRESYIEFDVAQPGEKLEHGPASDPELWKSAHKRIKEKVRPIRKDLERQFRSLLEAKQEV